MSSVAERIELEIEGQTVIVKRLEDGTFRKPAYLAGAEREVVGPAPNRRASHSRANGVVNKQTSPDSENYCITAPATDAAKLFAGYGTALKPAWEPIILAMKPLPGTFAQNALDYGVAGLWVDGCRIGTEQINRTRNYIGNKQTLEGGAQEGYFVSENQGRWPANLVLSHTPECRRVGVRKVRGNVDKPTNRTSDKFSGRYNGGNDGHYRTETEKSGGYADPDGYETCEKWECAPDCPVRLLDEQSGESVSVRSKRGRARNGNGQNSCYGGFAEGEDFMAGYTDTGGASRFFYTAKASRSEREAGLIGHLPCIKCSGLDTETHIDPKSGREVKCRRNGHPTVKPLELCRWLCRLTKTPTGGVVLDPFMGSGSIPLAAVLEGRDVIGIEQERASFEVAQVRIEAAQVEPIQLELAGA